MQSSASSAAVVAVEIAATVVEELTALAVAWSGAAEVAAE